MGSKTTNGQSRSAFGATTQSAVDSMNSALGNSTGPDAGAEEAARKRKQDEDAAAKAAAAQKANEASGAAPTAYEAIKSGGGLEPYNQGADYQQKGVWDKLQDAWNGVDPYTNKPKKK